MQNLRKVFVRCLIGSLFISLLLGCQGPTPQTLILISVDGFRWDYPEKTATPNLDFLIKNGVRAKRLIPCFPTKTFPNHYTIVTGLYPEHHGIVANSMYDPARKKSFRLSLPDAIHDPAWWEGEPIWVTAEKQGVRTAAFFWPGTATKIDGVRPTYWYEYDGSVPNATRIDQVLTWLDLPENRRPRLITTYFSITDDAGHQFGPDSPEIVAAIQEVDGLIGRLLHGLRRRDLLQRVNIIIVSDHGMCPISPEHVVYLDDYIDMRVVDVVDWNPVAALNPAPEKETKVYRELAHANPHMNVYWKSEVPARFHYSENPRIPKIIAIAQEGWSITSHGTVKPHYISGGNHGFDNQLESMGATFIAFGPAFRSGLTLEPFQNIHIYELMAHILGLRPAPNDGSLDSVKVMLQQDVHQPVTTFTGSGLSRRTP